MYLTFHYPQEEESYISIFTAPLVIQKYTLYNIFVCIFNHIHLCISVNIHTWMCMDEMVLKNSQPYQKRSSEKKRKISCLFFKSDFDMLVAPRHFLANIWMHLFMYKKSSGQYFYETLILLFALRSIL